MTYYKVFVTVYVCCGTTVSTASYHCQFTMKKAYCFIFVLGPRKILNYLNDVFGITTMTE